MTAPAPQRPWTAGPVFQMWAASMQGRTKKDGDEALARAIADLERKAAAAPAMAEALNYVADMTYCGQDAEWHFKPGYDPQVVLDALSAAGATP